MKIISKIGCAVALTLSATVVTAEDDPGQKIFERNCDVCHGGWGGYGAPGVGNYDAWRPALRRGEKGMMHSVLNGQNSMPPRGGNPTLSDKELLAAVRWIIKTVDGEDSVVLATAND